MKFLSWFDGKKTYLATIFGGLIVLAKTFGWIDAEQFDALIGLDIAFFGASIRDAIRKIK